MRSWLNDLLMFGVPRIEGESPLRRFQPPTDFGNDWLTNLHEVSLPQAVGFWPLGPGWWLLIFILLWLLLGVFRWRYRQWQRAAYRRQALQEIEACRRACSAGDLSTLQRLPQLLKRVALHSLQLAGQSRTQVTALTGAAWWRWLSQTCSQPAPESVQRLSELAYAPVSQLQTLPAADWQGLLDWCELWVNEHRINQSSTAASQVRETAL